MSNYQLAIEHFRKAEEYCDSIEELQEFFDVRYEACRLGRLSSDGDISKSIEAEMLLTASDESDRHGIYFWFRHGFETRGMK